MSVDLDTIERLAKAALSRGQEGCESLKDWFSQEEFMANMLLHPVDAAFAEAATPDAISALVAEVRALRTRLEIDPRHPYDGIACRDETILQQGVEIVRLREELNTPLLTGADAPMYGGIFCAEGINRDVAMSAFLSDAPMVTVYYGQKRVFTSMAEFEEARAKEKA